MPSSRHVRMIRTAISPRFAISTRRNGGLADRTARVSPDAASTRSSLRKDASGPGSERDVAMLLPRVAVPLVGEHLEGTDEAGSGLRRLDDVVDVAAGRGDIRVREFG